MSFMRHVPVVWDGRMAHRELEHAEQTSPITASYSFLYYIMQLTTKKEPRIPRVFLSKKKENSCVFVLISE
jgi:hypothetical protein